MAVGSLIDRKIDDGVERRIATEPSARRLARTVQRTVQRTVHPPGAASARAPCSGPRLLSSRALSSPLPHAGPNTYSGC